MKPLLVTVIVVLSMICLGWLSFGLTDGKASVTFDTDKAASDAEAVVEKGEKLLDTAADKGQEMVPDDGFSEDPEPSEGTKSSSDDTSRAEPIGIE